MHEWKHSATPFRGHTGHHLRHTSDTMDKFWTHNGQIWPMATPISQSWLEIGVHRGGLACVLAGRCEAVEDFHYFGIEISDVAVGEPLKQWAERQPKIQLWIADALSEKGMDWIKRILSEAPGPVLLICDGGNKAEEYREHR